MIGRTGFSRRPDADADRGRNGAVNIELPVEAGDAKRRGNRWRGRGQAQNAAEQPDAPSRANQHGKAAGVAVPDVGQVDDEPAGIGPQDAEELLTQRGSAGNIKITSERHNGPATLGTS
jgi:hypothetical protein